MKIALLGAAFIGKRILLTELARLEGARVEKVETPVGVNLISLRLRAGETDHQITAPTGVQFYPDQSLQVALEGADCIFYAFAPPDPAPPKEVQLELHNELLKATAGEWRGETIRFLLMQTDRTRDVASEFGWIPGSPAEAIEVSGLMEPSVSRLRERLKSIE